MTHILGIDPGVHGAIAVLLAASGELVSLADMPTVKSDRGRTIIVLAELARIIRNCSAFESVAYIERVSARPQQGVTSMFSFGRALGAVEGMLACAEIPVEYVTPQVWRRGTDVREGKAGSRERAAGLFPDHYKLFSRVKDDGRAEAALIAWWAHQRLREVL